MHDKAEVTNGNNNATRAGEVQQQVDSNEPPQEGPLSTTSDAHNKIDTATANNNHHSAAEPLPPADPTGFEQQQHVEEQSLSSSPTRLHLSQDEVNELRSPFNRQRYVQLALGIAIAIMGSIAHAFGLISNYIKERNNYSQSQMTTISTVGSIFANFAFPAGILFDMLGAQYVVLAEGLLTGTGFIVLALAFKGVIPTSIPTLAVANGLVNWGGSCADTGGLMTNLFNFPLNRGHIIIMQKTFSGLGSTFLSMIYTEFFSSTTNYFGYALFVAAYVYLVNFVGVFLMRLPPYQRTSLSLCLIRHSNDEEKAAAAAESTRSFALYHEPRFTDHRRLNFGLILLWIAFAYFSTITIVEAFVTISFPVHIVFGVLAILSLVFFWVMTPPYTFPAIFELNFLPSLSADEEYEVAVAHDLAKVSRGRNVEEVLKETAAPTEHAAPEAVLARNINTDESTADNHNGNQLNPTAASTTEDFAAAHANRMLKTTVLGSLITLRLPILWCFLWSSFCVSGIGYLFSNNAPQIYRALLDGDTYVDSMNTLNVALIGIGSALGRMIVGYGELILAGRELALNTRQSKLKELISQGAVKASDVASHLTPVHHHWLSSVTIMLPFPPFIMMLSCLFVLVLPAKVLPLAFFLNGIAVGSVVGLNVLSAREIFAVQTAMHFNACNLATMLAIGVLNSALFGKLYDAEASRQAAGAKSCSGLVCIRTTMIVGLVINASSIFTCMYVVYGWRRHRIASDNDNHEDDGSGEQQQKGREQQYEVNDYNNNNNDTNGSAWTPPPGASNENDTELEPKV